MTERRSPYLILGVPFGASKVSASRAFAKATRRLKRMTGAPYDLEDLNWALHAIEQRIEDPASSIDDYRLPADPTVYEIPHGKGILNPPIQPYARRTAPTDAPTVETIRVQIVREVAAALVAEWRNEPLPKIHDFPSSSVQQ